MPPKKVKKTDEVSSDAQTSESSDKVISGEIYTCTVCMTSLREQVQARKPMVTTYCGHVFCKQCIERTLKNEIRNCPVCRANIAPNKYIFMKYKRKKVPVEDNPFLKIEYNVMYKI
ncbi:E3 ubiquitin-protein ligase RNF4 [Trichinella nelsoni]|uniref:E3 ubiquitin-protein ligase RNF4 n=1 Tax=Trichinella nelsoni TaxID=6336 RepID=A0A0V0SL20_9BILA|nr:E3 ubiquitin-protein ligase RNF4 [Trichinella nelsoni]